MFLKSRLQRRLFALSALFLFSALALKNRFNLPLDRSSMTPLQDRFNNWVGNLDTNRTSNPFFTQFADRIRVAIEWFAHAIQYLISQAPGTRQIPQLGWLGVVAIVGFIVYASTNLRTTLFAAAGFISLGLLGFWTESMDTLALTIAAVLIALLIGIPLGIMAGLSTKWEKALQPILDFSQIMPTFVYLTPVTLLFLIGAASSTIVTLIYAIPPALRITAVAIREVPFGSVEAAASMGSTRMQILRKVQLPQAKRTIVVGINQTIMAALSMVTIAALIDAPGLGKVVILALESLDVGRSFQAGLAIVIMAVVLDRVTTAAAAKAAPDVVDQRKHRIHRNVEFVVGLVTLTAIWLSRSATWAGNFPGSGDLGRRVNIGANNVTNFVQDHFFKLTNAITNLVTVGFLNPLQNLLTSSPWFIVTAYLVGLALLLGGFRIAIITLVCALGIVYVGLWSDTMVTLAATLVAAALTVALGILVGVWIGRSKKADQVIRPILDAGQVLPAFVYLVPFLGLFGATRFTAIMAAIVYAAPAAIKLVADGIKGVPESIIESSIAAGSNTWQMITKVQLPSAKRALMLATNQGLIYVLAMIVVGGLVGAGGLGYLVVCGFSQERFKGKGLAAGLAIVLLGILIDRITQAAASRKGASVN